MRVSIPDSEIQVRAMRSSGPGGQHANVTASRIEATFPVDASETLSPDQKRRVKAKCGPTVTAVAQDTRSQRRNKDLALQRVRDRVERALVRPRQRRQTKPTRAAKQRRLDAKKRRGDTKRLRQPPSD